MARLAAPSLGVCSLSVQGLSARIALLCIGLVAANLGVRAWVLVIFHAYPVLLGTALLAYGFGLRHAVDADHIAAIDNVTRTLMQSGQRPVGVGLFFSLGHSTIVGIEALGLLGQQLALQGLFWSMVAALNDNFGLIGYCVIALFVLAWIGAAIFYRARGLDRVETELPAG